MYRQQHWVNDQLDVQLFYIKRLLLQSSTLFDVLLTVHLSIFISVINQLDAQNLFHNKFYFMPLHVSSTCAHHQEVKTVLHSLWYHHTYRCDDIRLELNNESGW